MTAALPYQRMSAITASDVTKITAPNAVPIAGYAIQLSVLAVPANAQAAMSQSARIVQILAGNVKKRFVRIA